MLYIANDTEIRSFVYPFNQSHGHKVLARIEENARIIGMDALLHQQKFIWATQFNPGGLFYKEILDRSQTKTNVGIIVSIANVGSMSSSVFRKIQHIWCLCCLAVALFLHKVFYYSSDRLQLYVHIHYISKSI